MNDLGTHTSSSIRQDYDTLVREWQTGGGEQIRPEFQKALAA